MPTPQSKDRGIGYFHFLLLKLGYSNKTNNPNASPSKRMFGLFSCGTSVHNETTKILCFTAFKTYSNRALPIKNR